MESYNRVHRDSVVKDGSGKSNSMQSYPATQPTIAGTSGSSTIDYISSASGFLNPRWRDQVRLGQSATTQFSGTKYKVDSPWCTAGFKQDKWIYSLPDYHTWYYQDWGGHIPSSSVAGFCGAAPTSVVNHVRNRALQKLYAQVESIRSSFESGQDLGEYKETLHTIVQPFTSLRAKTVHYLESLMKAKRRYRGRIPSLKKVLADSYLEWHFGVQPLVSDVVSAISDASRFRFPEYPFHVTASERYSGSTGTGNPSPVGYGSLLGGLTQKYKSYGTYSVTYKGVVRSGSNASGRIGWAQSLQLLPRNWAPTAWDLLPWSWAADFFANTGEIIRGLSFVRGDLAWMETNTRTLEIVETDNINLNIGAAIDTSSTSVSKVLYRPYAYGGSGRAVRETIVRGDGASDNLVPTLEFSLPHTKYQFADLAASLFSRYERLIPFF